MQLLHFLHGFYIYRTAFAFAVRILHLQHGFYISHAGFTFAMQLLHLLCGSFSMTAVNPSQPLYKTKADHKVGFIQNAIVNPHTG